MFAREGKTANRSKLLAVVMGLAMIIVGVAVITSDSQVSAEQYNSVPAVNEALEAGDVTIDNALVVSEGETLTIPEGKTLTIAGTVTLDGGEITGLGTINESNASKLIVKSGEINNVTFSTFRMAVTVSPAINGDITVSGCTFDSTGSNAPQAAVYVDTTGDYTINIAGCTFTGDYAQGMITVDAKETGNSTTTVEGDVTVSVAAGNFVAGSTVTATNITTLNINSNAVVTVPNGTTLKADTITGEGKIDVMTGGAVEAETSAPEISGDLSNVNIADRPSADRDFPNRITLDDGAVVDEKSNIYASSTQEVYVSGDAVVQKDGYIIIDGKLTIAEGASLTLQTGSKVFISGTGIVEVLGDLTVQAGAYAGENATDYGNATTFVYNGLKMDVAGYVSLEGADSFASEGSGITVSGLFEVGEEATATLDGTTVSETGEIDIYGIVTDSTINNHGTIVIDSQGIPESEGSDTIKGIENVTIQMMASNAVVDVTNLYGKLVVSDSELLVTEKRTSLTNLHENSIELDGVAGVMITENYTVEASEADENVNVVNNVMYISGSAFVADNYVANPDLNGIITLKGDNVEINETMSLAKNVKMVIEGTATISSDLTATSGYSTNNTGNSTVQIEIAATGVMTVTGKVTVNERVNPAEGGVINAALYQTAQYYVYTTLQTALADGATSITLLGANIVDSDATIPVNTTVSMDSASTLTIKDGATLTVVADDKKSGKLNTNGTADYSVRVEGTLVAQNDAKSGIKSENILSDTSKTVEDSTTYTNLYNALSNAGDGETVEVTKDQGGTAPEGVSLDIIIDRNVTVPAGVTLAIGDNQAVTVDKNVTVTVDGIVDITGTGAYNMTAVVDPDSKDKSAATVVNGMFRYEDDSLTSTYSESIVGAYFAYDDINAIAPFTSTPAIAADIQSDITLYGDMTVETIDFSAYDGEGDLATIIVNDDLTVGTITLGAVGISVTGESATITGTIGLANGTVDVEAVNGITAGNSTDADDVTTSHVGGTIATVQNTTTQKYPEGKIAMSGEIVSDIVSTTEYVTVDVPEGAVATINTGDYNGVVTVEGSMVINQNGTTFAVLTVVGGTVSAAADTEFTATADNMYVGLTEDNMAMAGTGAVSGVILADGTTSVAYVSPNATVGESMIDAAESTEYYAEDALYVTAYANDGNQVKIDIPFTVENAYFKGWQYLDQTTGKYSPISTTEGSADMVGEYPAVYADIKYDIYNVQITADAGIGTVAVDGIVLENTNGNQFIINNLAAGVHTISYTLKSGYQGEAKLTVNGDNATVNGMNFTLSGNPEGDDDTVIVKLSLSGTEPADQTVVIDNGGDDGLGLTDILLIILVVLIVIMAIIVALRMMRS